MRCINCGLAQLDRKFDPEIMYGETYGYRSGLSETMVAHLTALAHDLAARVGLRDGDSVLDIGCSDGTLLAAYEQQGIFRAGFDPAAKYIAPVSGLPEHKSAIYDSLFDIKMWPRKLDNAVPKIITAIAMFYDLDDPVAFLRDLRSILHEDGIICLELQFLPLCVQNKAIDIICHEHAVYYDGERLSRVIRDAGLYLEDVSFNAINGGSVRVILGRNPSLMEGPLEWTIRRKDMDSWLPITWEILADNIQRIGQMLRDYCSVNAVNGLGASTKGNVLLQHWGLKHRQHIQAIGEINPSKFGKVTPGTNIPIVDDYYLEFDFTYLVLPWWLKESFIKRYPDKKLLFPLPDPVLWEDGKETPLSQLNLEEAG